jgi:electron transfer flavoprotein beta subunit
LKIIVCVKQVLDSAAKVAVEGGSVTWGDAPLVINPWDEYAVEAALQLAEAHSGEVVALSLGDENAKEALKHALAMGCGSAILVNDPDLAETDSQSAARVLAAAVQKIGGADLVIFGRQAIDSDSGVTAAQTARVLAWPALTLVAEVSSLDPSAKTISARRQMEEGSQLVESKLPAVLSIAKDYSEPRYPSFMGIRKAAKAEIPAWGLADLGMDAPTNSIAKPVLNNPPASEVQNEIIAGGSPEELAANLADKIMQEKVL